MLYIKYRQKPYQGTTIEFVPDNDRQIPGLRDMLAHHFLIEHPAKTFAVKMNSGGYEGVPEDMVAADAERVNCLSHLWNLDGTGEMATANVLQILGRLMEQYVKVKKENDRLRGRQRTA